VRARAVGTVTTWPSRQARSGPMITPIVSSSRPWQLWMQPTSSTVPGLMIHTLPSLLRFQRAR